MSPPGRWRDLLPEAGRCWVRHLPVGWPGSSAPWVALDRLGLGEPGIGFELAGWGERALADVAWLPPTPESLADHRAGLLARHSARGTPVLSHRLPGDPPTAPPATDLLDLLPALVAGEDLVAATRQAAPDGIVLLPLVAGLTGGPERWSVVADAAREAGAIAVVPLALELEPIERRRLVELAGEALFEPIFHGSPASERTVAQVVATRGITPICPRPLPRPPLRGTGNARLGAILIEAAELALRAGEPERIAQALFAAGRFVDTTGYEVAALVRDGLHLSVPELAIAECRELLEDSELVPQALARRRARWLDEPGLE